MTTQFLHGVEVQEVDDGVRPIKTIKSSVIAIVGTAPEAKAEDFPVDTPVLISGSRIKAAKLGTQGTLPLALQVIFDQVGASVVVVRVDEGADDAATLVNVIGGTDAEGNRSGIQTLLNCDAVCHVKPRIVLAPGFTHEKTVAKALEPISKQLKAVALVDCSEGAPGDAITYRKEFADKRTMVLYPGVRVYNRNISAEEVSPLSSVTAGLIAKIDYEKGFWWSPSNQQILNILGTSLPIDHELGDLNSTSNLLNENHITTVIHDEGYRLWGNRTTTNDTKWVFINVVRTADLINDSLKRAHLWAVDRNLTATYFEDVIEGVNNYLRHLTTIGAILGGNCWADPDLNTADKLKEGIAYFNFDFTPPTPAEHIVFQSKLSDAYFKNVLSGDS
ncbi:phage tail sheath subtilisin-like domain-containing protein [Piscirickettsia litoralis]|uniref:Phage tail protein n=1 Tax=Piscirickettsia litoralis TaxID=1891921 RepID=A0ABX2ZYG1_9GAMM|nr:phage tail sheath subtilisin-like domain-containing protein [Piscirickettsia litoralis]ODN41548.1 phage tail protein [Piscirickettsia litoralis]